MTKASKIISNISRSFAGPIFNFAIALIGVQFLGKENWGAFIQILLWVYFITFLCNFGNKDYLLRTFSEKPSKMFEVFSINFFSRSVFLVLTGVFFIFFSWKLALVCTLLTLLIFSYQSLESLLIYQQKFLVQLVAELVGFLIIVGYIYTTNQIQTESLLLAYCFAFLLKTVILLFLLQIKFKQFKIQFSRQQIYALVPFFLIGFSGWLGSKIDLYIVNFYLPKARIAEYQLLITAFLMLQSFAALLIYPFSKHLYRLPLSVVKKIKNKVALASFPIVVVGTFCIWFVFEYVVNLNLATDLYILGALSAFPIYFFIVDIMVFYRNKNEMQVMKINFISSFLKLVLIFLFINSFGLKGVLLGVLITHIVILIFYKTKLFK